MNLKFSNKDHTQQQGFTLIELLVTIVVIVAVSALIVRFSVYYLQSFSFSSEETQSISLAQQAIGQLTRDIREARSGENGAYTLVDAQDNSLTFYSDITNDGRSDRVRYFIENQQLKRGITEPTAAPVDYPSANEKIKVIIDNIDLNGQALFTYYNGNWPSDTVNNPLALSVRLLNTRYVGIYTRVNVTTGSGSQPFELSSGVQIRSLKDNL